jgi:hypothetical protein
MIGWRRFWMRYTIQLKNLKELTANVPTAVFEDYDKSEVANLLSNER